MFVSPPQDRAVTSLSGVLDPEQLADFSLTTAAFRAGSITKEKLKNLQYTLPFDSLQSRHIADRAVTTSKFKSRAVTKDKLADGAVTSIGSSLVSSDKYAEGGVMEASLQDGAVQQDNFQDGGVASEDLAVLDGEDFEEGAVGGVAFAGEAVTQRTLADGAISSEAIGGGQITSASLDMRSIVTSKLRDLAVQTRHIAEIVNEHLADQGLLSDQFEEKTLTWEDVNPEVTRLLQTGLQQNQRCLRARTCGQCSTGTLL